jgi:hypothetical protein
MQGLCANLWTARGYPQARNETAAQIPAIDLLTLATHLRHRRRGDDANGSTMCQSAPTTERVLTMSVGNFKRLALAQSVRAYYQIGL